MFYEQTEAFNALLGSRAVSGRFRCWYIITMALVVRPVGVSGARRARR
jgi:hypothetical protein